MRPGRMLGDCGSRRMDEDAERQWQQRLRRQHAPTQLAIELIAARSAER